MTTEGRPHEVTLVDLLRRRAIEDSGRLAFTYLSDGEIEEASLTYGELDCRARRLAARLQSEMAPGTRACLFYPAGLEYVTALFGCLYAGVIAVPGYPPRSGRRLDRLETLVENPEGVVALSTKRTMALMRPSLDAAPEAIRRLSWILSDATIDSGGAWRAPDIDAESIAVIQYTSGSTAGARGVMLTHANLLHNLDRIRGRFGVSRESLAVIWLPPYHDMGLIGGILGPVFTGFPCVLMSPAAFFQRPVRWLQAISKYHATASGGPNFAYDLCVRRISPADRDGLDLSTWATAFNGAEPVRPDTMYRFAQAFASCGFRRSAFQPCYGLAEATLLVTSGQPLAGQTSETVLAGALAHGRVETGEGAAVELAGCGRAIGDTCVRIVDPQSCSPAPPDRVGEIWVSGPSVAAGYWNRPEETAGVFGAELGDGRRYLRTGDSGYLRDGELFVTGRLKDLVILDGANYHPHDIEAAVEGCHDALRHGCAAAFGVAADGSERLVMVLEAGPLAKYSSGEVVAAVRRAVSDRQGLEVRAVVLIKAGTLPKTSSGKIRRGACRDAYLAGELEVISEWQCEAAAAAADEAGPRTGAEIREWLIAQLSQRLAMAADEIDVRRPFSEYGLDSGEAVSLALEMETWLGRPAPPTLVWDYPTIELLARHFAGTGTAPRNGSPAAAEDEPLAVIGMACRFPGAADTEAFWDLLRSGGAAISNIPQDRATLAALRTASGAEEGAGWGGFLKDVDLFDPYFFGIAPREAAHMDPQQRLLLEVTWEALEDAGKAPATLAGSRTGVFIGISNADYAREQTRGNGHLALDMYSGTGNALSIAANRISYLLDAKGPSMAVDTACSSSMVALDLARQSLQRGESAMAIVGGVNLILSPEPSLVLARRQMLAPDGKCKVFDRAANGYVRGEGCGVVVLKRLSEALSAGDRIAGVILASTVNQDGRTNGLTAPNGPSQQDAIRQALRKAGVAANEVGYFETHGTGTALGDAIEAESLAAVFGGPEEGSGACWMGSLKANVGHLEPAAGIASLIKTLLALEKGEIPPQIHLEQINPQIALEKSRLRIPRQLEAWPRNGRRRVAAINSFGFGGTNVTAVVAEAPDGRAAERARSRPCEFRRERFWFDERSPGHEEAPVRPLLGRRVNAAVPVFELRLSLDAMPYLADHAVEGQAIFPAAGYLEMVLEALMEHHGESGAELTEVVFPEPLRLHADSPRTIQVVLSDGEGPAGWFRIFSRPSEASNGAGWTLHAKGQVRPLHDESECNCGLEAARKKCAAGFDRNRMYEQFHSRGMHYGERFRGIQQVWTGEAQALGRVAIHPSLEAVAGDFSIHPTFLDGCLQVLGPAAMPSAGGAFLPVGVDRFRWHGGYLAEGWSHACVTAGPNRIRGDVRVFDPHGRLAFEVLGIALVNTSEPAGTQENGLVYEIQWEPKHLATGGRELRGHWRVVAEQGARGKEVCDALRGAGADCEDQGPGADVAGVVYIAAFDTAHNAEAAERLAEHALAMLQTIAAAPSKPEVWLVARGGQPGQAPLWGLGRAFRLEYPAVRTILVDVDPDCTDWAAGLAAEITSGGAEPEVMLRNGTRFVRRFAPVKRNGGASMPVPGGESYCLGIPSPGTIDSLALAPQKRPPLAAGEVELRVHAAGMNFSDVMKAMGIYPGPAANPVLGAECAGVVERIGEGVAQFAPGDEVMGIAPQSFAPFTRTHASLVVRKPKQLRFEEGAAIPVAFLTAAYALYGLARVRRGERVLIHSASGGVGLAAVQLARRAGAEVLATAGTAEKRAFLEGMGIDAVFDSRSLEFAERIRRHSGGYGVDVVLNSLPGEAMARSLDLLASHGRFLEIGKTDIYRNGRLPLEPFQRAISYFAIDLDRLFRERTEEMRELLTEIAGWFEAGELKPLPLRVFPIQEAREAFRHMAQAKHIGKIVLSPAEPNPAGGLAFRPDATYLVTGGLGALGLQVAEWMASAGAGRIVLMGRSAPSAKANAAIAELGERGVEVVVRCADVSDAGQVERMIAEVPETAPLRGVVHAAGVPSDATLANTTDDSLRRAMQPKAGGAWNLHCATTHLPLDFFVLFSSVASVLGSPGQGSYCAANAFLDSLAAYRRSLGMAALAVNWGPWAGDGMAAGQRRRFEQLGLHMLEPAQALRALEGELGQRRSGQVIVAGANLAAANPSAADAGTGEVTPRRELDVEAHILEHIARVSGIAQERIDRERNLGDLGIDSLTALELMNELEKTLQMKLPVSMSAGDLSVSALAAQIAQHLAR